jgi:hypothetical protein
MRALSTRVAKIYLRADSESTSFWTPLSTTREIFWSTEILSSSNIRHQDAMPPQKAPAVDAWENDDWEAIADVLVPLLNRWVRAHISQKEDEKPKEDQPPAKLSKAQRKAQHAELNRKIWESAYVNFLPAQQ